MRSRFRKAATVLTASLALAVAAPVPSSPAQAAPPPMLLGLDTKWDDGFAHDNTELNVHAGINNTFWKWNKTGTNGSSVLAITRWLDRVRALHAVPMIHLSPADSITLSQVAAGHEDGYITQWAQAFAAHNGPILLRLFGEMNRPKANYAIGTPGNSASAFRAAFRKVVTIFRANGASNVRFVWNPNRVFQGSFPLNKLWPGNSYVDWVGWDFYNWHDAQHGKYTPYQLIHGSVAYFNNMVKTMASVSYKPQMIAEVGVAEYAGKPTWIQNFFPVAQKQGIKAVCWYNYDTSPGPNWRLDSKPSGTLSASRTALHVRSVVTYYGPKTLAQIESFVLNKHW
jgi:hypothetical protein